MGPKVGPGEGFSLVSCLPVAFRKTGGVSLLVTVRFRTMKTLGCLSRKTALAMVLQLVLAA